MTLVTLNNRPALKAFNGLFDSLINEFETSAKPNLPAGLGRFQPLANVVESEDAFHLELNAPGRNKAFFTLQVEDGVLTIGYEDQPSEKASELKHIRKEFTILPFKRSFNLGEQINAEAIQAKYEDGLLKVLLPKKAEVKPAVKQITVQ